MVRIVLLISVFAFGACHRRTPSGRAPAVPAPVTVGEVVKMEVPIGLGAVGNVRPSATVTVKPRVGGLLASVEFQEGQDVKIGDILYRIDPRPYEVALAKSKAILAQLEEQAANAGKQEQRYTSIGRSGVVAEEQLAQVKSTAKTMAAAATAGEAAVKEAEIDLSYCTIRSPIAGRTGRRMVDAGNVVTANVTELVVVNQIVPVEVAFSVPEGRLVEISRYQKEGALKVSAVPTGQKCQPAEGELNFVDNAVNPNTGTIELKALFPNAHLALWPGQFASVTLTLAVEKDALVVPAAAIQIGQKGHYVYVLKADSTVELRPVELARTLKLQAVLRKGVQEGERVVLDGQLGLVPGAKVEVKAVPVLPAATGVPEKTEPVGKGT